MDFNITPEEERLLFMIADHLDAGNVPTVDELTTAVGHDAQPKVHSLSQKGWVLVNDHGAVVALSPMALQAVRNLRYGGRGEA